MPGEHDGQKINPRSDKPDRAPRLDGLLDLAFRQSMPVALYLVATPIGNLADLTIRAIAVLCRADAVYCEDTRMTRRLFEAFGVSRSLSAYHDHNAEAARPEILRRLAEGQSIALVSDAGMPLVSDPGYKLVRAAIDEGFQVVVIPGPTASVSAAAVSGIPCDAFQFVGFLPAKSAARRKRLAELAVIPSALVIYESANRLAAMLSDAADVLGVREAAIARELTKRFEDVRRGPLDALEAAVRKEPPKGEIAVVIGPPAAKPETEVDDAAIVERLTAELESKPLAKAARDAAAALGVTRNRAYALGLQLKAQSDGREIGDA